MQRAVNSSAWVADWTRALAYFFTKSVPENRDQIVMGVEGNGRTHQDK
jgi:hypothetical protein